MICTGYAMRLRKSVAPCSPASTVGTNRRGRMYRAEADPYCYPDSTVLRNNAGLTSAEALEEFESAMTFARAEEPLPRGRFSVRHYRAVHHHLFQDVATGRGIASYALRKMRALSAIPRTLIAR